MKIKTLLAALCLCALAFTLGAQTRRPQFEYKYLYKADLSGDDLQKLLNQSGAEGWELVYVRPRNDFAGGDYIFKRQK